MRDCGQPSRFLLDGGRLRGVLHRVPPPGAPPPRPRIPRPPPAALRPAGGGGSHKDGRRQPGDGVRAQLPALPVAGPLSHTGMEWTTFSLMKD